MYWLPRHIKEVVLSAHDPKQNAHLLDFHFSERPQLFGAKDWIQPLSDDEISDVKHIHNMCQLNMSFKVAGTPLQLQFLEWIAPRSWYGGAGSVVIQQQDLTTPALPLSSSEPQPRHCSRSQSPVSYFKKRRFPDGDDDALFIAATRSTLDGFPLQHILNFIRDKNYIVFHTKDLGLESGPKRRGSLVHSASEVKQRLLNSVQEDARHSESLVVAAEKKRIEDVAEVDKQRIADLAEVDKQRIEDRAEVDKRRIADMVAVEKQKIEDVAAAEMQRIDDCATVKKRRIDDCAAAEKQRINDYAMVQKQGISNSAPAEGVARRIPQGSNVFRQLPTRHLSDGYRMPSTTASLKPHAMVLSTVGKDNAPDARMLILKDMDARGWHSAIKAASPRGEQIASNSQVALTFYWKEQARQIQLQGRAQQLPEDEWAKGFADRPRDSKISAAASKQSAALTSRDELSEAAKGEKHAFSEEAEGVAASGWKVYAVAPQVMEFWQGFPDRLRVEGHRWEKQLLWPYSKSRGLITRSLLSKSWQML
ncbi:uncharacterized protein Triagg1_6099 [Trichoderma aggressivum f. europaeum]|uniref:pyridoxal 5'-phosphate synthase n=1 Tax=Trichoderma aggressivum f. europaeum TaxID=173218 RepID=A0AAE1LXY2_9HYPO|nr:hypothetical protein Triagg1_6099 [Trichoderma aggressivum f. europaeum]